MKVVINVKKSMDLRIIKTKKALYEALITLLEEKEYEEIKVSDICGVALVNRSTFYAHFSDKYDLFDSFLNDLKQSLINELDEGKQVDNITDYYLDLIQVFMNHIENNKSTYKSIIVNNRNSIIIDMLYDTIRTDCKKRLEEISNPLNKEIPNEIMIEFYLGAIVNLGISWINNSKYTKEEMINYLNKLLPKD